MPLVSVLCTSNLDVFNYLESQPRRLLTAFPTPNLALPSYAFYLLVKYLVTKYF